jgi:hypothetical protein
MAVLTSYFDASGHEGGPHALTVGGFIADASAWNRFSLLWPVKLAKHGITVPFRMTAFMSGQPGFERFKDDPDLQALVLRDLVQVICQHTRFSPSTTVLTEDWNDVNQEYWMDECHCTQFAVAAFNVINKSMLWMGKKKHGPKEFVFEEGDAGRDDFEWLVKQIIKRNPESLSTVRPRFDSKALPPLQASDLAVWEQRNFVREKLEGTLISAAVRDLRPAVRRLVRRPYDWGVMNRRRIALWAERIAVVPKRSEPFDEKTWRPFPYGPLGRA